MTTLQSFQSEIQEIARKEKELAHLKIQKPSESKPNSSTQVPAKVAVIATNSQQQSTDDHDEDDVAIQDCLMDPSRLSEARDLLAERLLSSRGELVLNLGLHPPLEELWKAETPLTRAPSGQKEDGWRGKQLTNDELQLATRWLEESTEELGGSASTLFKSADLVIPRSSHLLRLPPPNVEHVTEVRCAVVGNVDVGKSTTLGVLTRGSLDDGRGKAREVLFRHKHEIESGRTSSVGMEILGFAMDGTPILPNLLHSHHQHETEPVIDRNTFAPANAKREKIGWDEIAAQSSKIVSFIDLAGHERYLKTSLFGMTSGAPDCVLLMVGGNAGMIGMTKEHLAIALALTIPVVVAITKIDMTPPNVLQETKKQLLKILQSPGCRKTPVFVKNMETVVQISRTFSQAKTKAKICPIFMLSNVTGDGLEMFRTFLNLVPSSEGDQNKYPIDAPLEYSITDIWSVPHVGTVVNGLIASGKIQKGDAILFGPDSNGTFQPSVVKDMQRKRASVSSAEAGQCVSLALKRVRKAAVRKGMVIVGKNDGAPKAVRRFEGQVLILYHNSTLQINYQAMLHCGAIRQTVRIIGMDNPSKTLRTGDRATVQFEFMSRPEFLKPGMKLLFREGKTKGLGVVTGLLP